jgi:peptidoglycan-N-acetylglucosamine deacetylase
MLLPAKIPFFLPLLYPQRIWKVPTGEKKLYLTFDDGPHPRITARLLDMLRAADARASFFCIGDRVISFPTLYQRILDEGHVVGNHTQHHLNGRKVPSADYLHDIQAAGLCIRSTLFRPPYGRLRSDQARAVQEMGMKTIMWTVLSADYDQALSKETCASRVLEHINAGNIYLFHDSEKAEDRMFYAVEQLLKAGTRAGFCFSALPLNFH